jgi:6-phosphogluconolactonase
MIRKFAPLFMLILFSCSAGKYFLVTGTYTSTGSNGIYVHEFDAKDASFKPIDSAHSSNPSFLAISKNGQHLYAVNEDAHGAGAVSSFLFDKKTGKLSFLNKRSSMGDHPCHLVVDATGKWLMTANYSSANIAGYRIRENGSIDSSYQVIQLTGKSIHPKRQLSAHAHQVMFSADNKFLYATDLGADKIMIYSFDDKTGVLKPAAPAFVSVTAGAGPRHIVFHPTKPFAYLIEELTGYITAYSINTKSGALTTMVRTSGQPKDFTGFAGSAEIVMSRDGNFLYSSNRGDANTISSFSINPVVGWPMLLRVDSTLGKAPRHFSIDPIGKWMLVANMDSDEIVVFRRNKTSGLLSNTGIRTSIKKPVCLLWVEKE